MLCNRIKLGYSDYILKLLIVIHQYRHKRRCLRMVGSNIWRWRERRILEPKPVDVTRKPSHLNSRCNIVCDIL